MNKKENKANNKKKVNDKKIKQQESIESDKHTIVSDTVDKIIQMFPKLEKNKSEILENILNPIKKEAHAENILSKINHNGKIIYRDQKSKLFERDDNGSAKLIGLWSADTKGNYNYYIFGETSEIMRKYADTF